VKGIISDKNKALFKPFFPLAAGSKTVQVSLEEFESNPVKYVETGIGYMYENRAELREAIKNKALKPVKLDMSKAKRGKAFNPASLKDDVADMLAEQQRRRARVAARFEKQNKAEAKKATDKKPPVPPAATK